VFKFLKSIFGSRNQRLLRQYGRLVTATDAHDERMRGLPDDAFPGLTAAFERTASSKGETLDSLLPEAFAAVREAGRRTLGMRHFDVQLIGGIALHQGKISEMRTGEGKTLVATLPTYLNALPGLGAHVVTVNERATLRTRRRGMDADHRFLEGDDPLAPFARVNRRTRSAQPTPATSPTARYDEYGFDGSARQPRIPDWKTAYQRHASIRGSSTKRRFSPDRPGTDAAHHLRTRRRKHEAHHDQRSSCLAWPAQRRQRP
jgi:preprotein translocase subunit SecA